MWETHLFFKKNRECLLGKQNMSALTTMLVGEGAKLDVHGCKTVDMASSFGKVDRVAL